ncbi:MAG: hypothetical protein ACLP3K_04085 [Candidatus Acidiferrales bacterium]
MSATMDRSEVITSEGQGVWGARYELRLLTSVCTYSDSSRQTNKALQSYVVEFGPKSQADRRSFKSDEARRLFLEQSFSDLVLTEIPESKREIRRIVSPLQAVVGEYLSSVNFVMDYLQLDFSGYGFTMNSWPTLTIENRTLAHADGGYKDALCSLIGETATEVDEYWDTGLRLRFKNGSSIDLSLRVERDFPSPEVAIFHNPTNGFAIIWSAGEEPFD